jgi:hypothetical protein
LSTGNYKEFVVADDVLLACGPLPGLELVSDHATTTTVFLRIHVAPGCHEYFLAPLAADLNTTCRTAGCFADNYRFTGQDSVLPWLSSLVAGVARSDQIHEFIVAWVAV